MMIIYFIIVALYMFFIFCIAEKACADISGGLDVVIQKKRDIYEEKLIRKKDLVREKLDLEEETLKIFTLYEMTREITRSLSDEEAFEIFKSKLQKHVQFSECRIYEAHDIEVKSLTDAPDFLLFTLQSKSKQMGYLSFKGIKATDREKVMILGHQFALALRRVKLYEEIERIAITDSLTGLFTRRYAFGRFQEEMHRSKDKKYKLSILMIDVDFFKKFNDNFGHLTGDQVLREISNIVRQNIREIDIPGRYGGEEFFIILPDTDRDGALYAAERIRKATEETLIKAYDATIKATVSVGIATYPQDGTTAEELIDKADWALYRSKKLGRNRVSSFGVYDK